MSLDLGFSTLRWEQNHLVLLDQTQLPTKVEYLHCQQVSTVVAAMQRLSVRGAPAIGCAAAYAMLLEMNIDDSKAWLQQLDAHAELLKNARPTAVNLRVGVDHLQNLGHALAGQCKLAERMHHLTQAAKDFHQADAEACLALAEHGQQFLFSGARVLTHCNAGALATGGIGTALGPLHLAHSRGISLQVYADETRPLRQGARLTAWELAQHGIAVKVLPDSAAASLLANGQVDLVFVGADRIAANGDFANKIGTYPLAVLAQRHQVPFYVLTPSTTIDAKCPRAETIPIEMRGVEELFPDHSCPPGVDAWNPAFDCTPAELVTGILTEHGCYCPTADSSWSHYVASLNQSET